MGFLDELSRKAIRLPRGSGLNSTNGYVASSWFERFVPKSCTWPCMSSDHQLSGLIVVDRNDDAFECRLLSARSATSTLDLIYYMWRLDRCGQALLEEVIRAADRGVAVRLLIDDVNPSDSDGIYLWLNSHPKIELRLFNPSAIRQRGPLRWAEFVCRMSSLNRRMHLKAWIADAQTAIVGGRNIGDEYFGEGNTSFCDLDVLLLGSAVRQTSEIFEAFWSHPLAQAVHRLNKMRDLAPSTPLSEGRGTHSGAPSGFTHIKQFIDARNVRWIHNATVLADPPDKALGEGRNRWLTKTLLPAMTASQRHLEIISPYFIPGARGLELLAAMCRRGVVVTVLTNSLAATDVAAVHGAYANYRRRLLRSGVSLFEFQPFDGRGRISAFGSKGASLHTKAFAIDGRVGFIGSFNFDPRSASLNAEMGVMFEDESLVRRLLDIVDDQKQADRSFWVSLNRGILCWTGSDHGRLRKYHAEPLAGVFRRTLAWLVRWLRIETYL